MNSTIKAIISTFELNASEISLSHVTHVLSQGELYFIKYYKNYFCKLYLGAKFVIDFS